MRMGNPKRDTGRASKGRLSYIMKALKHIAGILLATVGALFVLSSVDLFFARDREVSPWAILLMFGVLGLLPLGGAFALLRKTVTAPGRSCPQCADTQWQP